MKKLLLIVAVLTLSVSDLWCQEVKEPKSPGTKAEEVAWKDAPVMALAFSPDDSLLAAAYASGAVKIWRTKDWKLVNQVLVSNRSITVYPKFGKMVFLSTETIVLAMDNFAGRATSITGSANQPDEDAVIKVLNVANGQVLKKINFEGIDRRINWVQTIQSGDEAYVYGNYKGKAKLVAINTGTLKEDIKNLILPDYYSQALSADGKCLYAIERMERRGQPLVLRKVNLENKELTTYQIPYEVPTDTHTWVEEGGLAISEDGKMAVVGLKLWTACPDDRINNCEGPADATGQMYLFDLSGKKVMEMFRENLPVVSLLFAAKGTNLVSMTCGAREHCDVAGGTLKVWDVKTGRLLQSLQEEGWAFEGVISSTYGAFVSGMNGKHIMVWSLGKDGYRLVTKL